MKSFREFNRQNELVSRYIDLDCIKIDCMTLEFFLDESVISEGIFDGAIETVKATVSNLVKKIYDGAMKAASVGKDAFINVIKSLLEIPGVRNILDVLFASFRKMFGIIATEAVEKDGSLSDIEADEVTTNVKYPTTFEKFKSVVGAALKSITSATVSVVSSPFAILWSYIKPYVLLPIFLAIMAVIAYCIPAEVWVKAKDWAWDTFKQAKDRATEQVVEANLNYKEFMDLAAQGYITPEEAAAIRNMNSRDASLKTAKKYIQYKTNEYKRAAEQLEGMSDSGETANLKLNYGDHERLEKSSAIAKQWVKYVEDVYEEYVKNYDGKNPITISEFLTDDNPVVPPLQAIRDAEIQKIQAKPLSVKGAAADFATKTDLDNAKALGQAAAREAGGAIKNGVKKLFGKKGQPQSQDPNNQ